MLNTIQPGLPASSKNLETHDAKEQKALAPENVSETNQVGIKPQVTDFDVDTVVNNILSFVRQRISAAPADQQESMLEQAKEGILKGFSEAGNMLNDMGRLNEDFEGGMNNALQKLDEKLTDVDSLFTNDDVAKPVMLEESHSKKAQRVETFVSNSQSISMSITTRDGDKISLTYSADSIQQANAMSNKYGYIYQWSAFESTGLALVVDGDLDIDEKEALNNLLNNVDKLATEFFDGDLGVAYKMAQDLDINMSELSSLDLNMKEVDVSSIRAYGQVAAEDPKHHNIPKGLSPLANYARQMVDAANDIQVQGKFSPQQLMDLMSIHPLMKEDDVMNQNSIFDQLFNQK